MIAKINDCVMHSTVGNCALTLKVDHRSSAFFMVCDNRFCRVAGIPLDIKGHQGQQERHTGRNNQRQEAVHCKWAQAVWKARSLLAAFSDIV